MLRFPRNPWFGGLAAVTGLIVAIALVVLGGRFYVAWRTPDWIAQLKDPDPAVRRNGALWLNEMAPPTHDVLEALMVALQDEYVGVRQQAAHGLGKFGPEASRAVPLLVEALTDEDAAVRTHAATSLRRIGHDPSGN